MGGEIYNIYERPPKVEGSCDNDGGELMQRPDDREEVVGPRLQAYEKQTAPLVAYYRRLGLLHDVDARKSVEEVNAAGNLAGVAERSSSRKARVETMAIQSAQRRRAGKDAPRGPGRSRSLERAA